MAFAAACDRTVLVTTPDVTAMTDAYAFLKVFVRQCAAAGVPRELPLLVVNRATSDQEARPWESAQTTNLFSKAA